MQTTEILVHSLWEGNLQTQSEESEWSILMS